MRLDKVFRNWFLVGRDPLEERLASISHYLNGFQSSRYTIPHELRERIDAVLEKFADPEALRGMSEHEQGRVALEIVEVFARVTQQSANLDALRGMTKGLD